MLFNLFKSLLKKTTLTGTLLTSNHPLLTDCTITFDGTRLTFQTAQNERCFQTNKLTSFSIAGRQLNFATNQQFSFVTSNFSKLFELFFTVQPYVNEIVCEVECEFFVLKRDSLVEMIDKLNIKGVDSKEIYKEYRGEEYNKERDKEYSNKEIDIKYSNKEVDKEYSNKEIDRDKEYSNNKDGEYSNRTDKDYSDNRDKVCNKETDKEHNKDIYKEYKLTANGVLNTKLSSDKAVDHKPKEINTNISINVCKDKSNVKMDFKVVDLYIFKDGCNKYLRIEDEKGVVYYGSTDKNYEIENNNLEIKEDENYLILKFKDKLDLLCTVSHFKADRIKEDLNAELICTPSNEENEDMLLSDKTFVPIGDKVYVPVNDVDQTKNKNLLVDNMFAYVTRGDSIGIFREGTEFIATIKNIKGVQKMIGSEDNTLILMDSENKELLRKLDLGRGEVVEEWKIGRKVLDCAAAESELVGVAEREVFKLDGRTREKVVASKIYKGDCRFNCVAADGSGTVAVAAETGDLRIYDDVNKRAKSRFAGINEKVTAVDFSMDGRFVVCTCEQFLMLYEIKNLKMGSPIRLSLKPEHVAFIKERVNFTNAKFNGGSAVVTSTGHYLIAWDLNDVMEGRVFNYNIKKYGEVLVENGFIDTNNIVVTLPDDVKRINKGDLRKDWI